MTASGSTSLRATPEPAGAVRPAPAEPDWPVQATDAIVKVVDGVRDKTTGPALDIARWLTYGFVLLLLVLPLAVLALVGVIRLLEGGLLLLGSSQELAWLHDPVWIVYTFLGALFTLVGLVLWRKGRRPSPAR